MRRPLEVLLVTHHRGEIGGVERDWINAANALGGHRVRLTWAGISGTAGLVEHVDPAVLRATADVPMPLFSYLVHESQYARRSPFLWSKIVADHFWRSWVPVRELRALLHEGTTDLVLSGTSVVTSGAIAARAQGIPHVWAVKEWLDSSLATARGFARLIAAASRAVIVPSPAVAEVFGGRAVVVPDGTDPALVQTGRWNATGLRRMLGFEEGKPLVVQCGTLSWWKGQHVSIEAVRLLAERSAASRFALLYLGGGARSYEENLRAAAARLPPDWARSVRFAASPPGDLRYLAAADVVIHPSVLPDPFPNAVREALLLGKPVVASRAGGIPEMIEDGETGLLVTPGDPRALAGALERLLGDPGLCARLGAQARVRAHRHLSSRETSDRLAEVLLTAAGR